MTAITAGGRNNGGGGDNGSGNGNGNGNGNGKNNGCGSDNGSGGSGGRNSGRRISYCSNPAKGENRQAGAGFFSAQASGALWLYGLIAGPEFGHSNEEDPIFKNWGRFMKEASYLLSKPMFTSMEKLFRQMFEESKPSKELGTYVTNLLRAGTYMHKASTTKTIEQ